MNQLPLIGHKKQQTVITSLIAENKLPHAILLHGTDGIGKSKFAIKLALMLICGNNPAVNKQRFSVNYDSDNFKRIVANSLDEFKIICPIDGKKNINVEQIREVINNLSLTADNKRVIIVNSADNLQASGANALLKTLEEPPANTLLILISSSPAKLLPTITSRCRKFKLDNLSINEVEQILEQEEINFNQQALDFCNGSVSKANEFMTDGKQILELLNNFFASKLSPADIIEYSEKLSDKKLKESLVYSQIKDVIYSATKSASKITHNLESLPCVKFLAKNYTPDNLTQIYNLVLETQKMRNAINLGQANCLENIFKQF